jgi:sigma54-dependent transcription regulator
VGQSPRMFQLLETARRAAASSATVLLLDETGTGKEVIARALHRWNPRTANPFIVVNCAALPESLLENELFGHEKGAYTGALRREPGRLKRLKAARSFWMRSATCRLYSKLASSVCYRIRSSTASAAICPYTLTCVLSRQQTKI